MEQTIEKKLKTIVSEIESYKTKYSVQQPVTLVAVSKTKPADRIREAYKAGQRVFGESRIQEAQQKLPTLADLDITWHLVGHLQTNKVKFAVPLFDVIESVDSERLAKSIDRFARAENKIMQIFIQVNTSGEAQKYGVPPSELGYLLKNIQMLEHIKIIGLMTIGPLTDDETAIHHAFKQLRQLRDTMQEKFPHIPLKNLSMGMSGDYPIAIQEGATHVRIGTAIFGDRPTP